MGRKARLDLVLDCTNPTTLKEFWREALSYRELYADAAVAVLVPADDTNASPLVLQQVPEPRAGKNRMHLDIEVPDIEAEAARLETLGATRVQPEQLSEHGSTWILMADPEGNEFCVCDAGASAS